MRTFSALEACAHAGISYRQFDLWTRRGYVCPAGAGLGSGSRRRVTADQVYLLALLGRASAAGISVDIAYRVASVDRDRLVAAVELIESALKVAS